MTINKKIDVAQKTKDIMAMNDSKALIERPLVDWRPILASECQVYVFGELYLAKRFDQINYKFCASQTAEEILTDNLYALLRFKYFPKLDDAIDERINDIVKSFTKNLKTSLIRVSLNEDEDCEAVKWLPDGCIAFRNGVYDFRNDKWLFKYTTTTVPNLKNTLYLYDPQYIITWYLNINFEPLPFNIMETPFWEFVDGIKELDKDHKNYCFELMYNMAHNYDDEFIKRRFIHLCEIGGYLCLQSFAQKFVLFVGSGQNGKNSLIDGCFTDRLVPKPASVDINFIEQNQFATGALENKSHNIYLETTTNDNAYKDNTNLKALTGSQDQSICHKGIDPYSGILNLKYLWSANDQDKVKFADTTVGFRRRINIFEIYYHWDSEKRFMKKGDYYDTTFSENLSELKGDTLNLITFIYFAMYGIKSGTEDFTKSFNFTDNDWRLSYSDIDVALKENVENVTPEDILNWVKRSVVNRESAKTLFFDLSKTRLFESVTLKELNYNNYEDFLRFLANDDDFMDYFSGHDCYVSIQLLRQITNSLDSANTYTQKFKKAFNIQKTITLSSNRPYVKCKFVNKKLRILAQ